MCGLLRDLTSRGFATELLVLKGCQMREVLLKIAEKAHTEEQRKKPTGQRVAWAAAHSTYDGLSERLASIEDGQRYFYGWLITYPHAVSAAWRESHPGGQPSFNILDTLTHVACIDGGLCTHTLQGVLFGLHGLDANRQNVPITMAYFADNENALTWGLFCEHISNTVEGGLARWSVITDLRKEGVTAMSKALSDSVWLACAKHGGDECSKRRGLGDRARDHFDTCVWAQARAPHHHSTATHRN